MKYIKLQSNDGVEFLVELEVVMCSTTIQTMLENLGIKDGDEHIPIPLPVIDAVTLDKVIQWAMHYRNAPPLEEGDPNILQITTNLSEWDTEFFKMDDAMLFNVIKAANYLDIKLLMEISCKAVANQMEEMTTEQLRVKFGIQNDLTWEEKEKINKFEF